ncbi:MAG: hypothetical protein AB8C46_13730 [Burkholderiaceae bacterium]
MPENTPRCFSRRRHLLMLGLVPVVGCTTAKTTTSLASAPQSLPRHDIKRLGLLPTRPDGAVGLDHLSSSLGFTGGSAGMNRIAHWGGRESHARDFTRLLKQNGLAAASTLRQKVHDLALEQSVAVINLDQTALSERAVNDWSFTPLAATSDAVVLIRIEEIAYSSIYTNAFWPRIHATMTVVTTNTNSDLGERDYKVRINAETTDQRDIRPRVAARFQTVNELMANPRQVVKTMNSELEAIAHLMADDLAAIARGQTLKWGTV